MLGFYFLMDIIQPPCLISFLTQGFSSRTHNLRLVCLFFLLNDLPKSDNKYEGRFWLNFWEEEFLFTLRLFFSSLLVLSLKNRHVSFKDLTSPLSRLIAELVHEFRDTVIVRSIPVLGSIYLESIKKWASNRLAVLNKIEIKYSYLCSVELNQSNPVYEIKDLIRNYLKVTRIDKQLMKAWVYNGWNVAIKIIIMKIIFYI